MVILNMGIPRSGTTWAFNVFRNIFLSGDIEFDTIAANSPSEVDEALDTARKFNNVIIHCHDITEKLLESVTQPGFVPYFCYRDPRDVVVSQMHLHKVDFESAVNMTVAAYQSLERASRISGMMLIPYPHIADNAEALIFQMAARMGHVLDFCTVKSINGLTSVRHHKEILAQPDRPKELFLCNEHIQSGRNGRWREELTLQQQERVNTVFDAPLQFFRFDCVVS